MRKGLFVSIVLVFSMALSLSSCSLMRDIRFSGDIVSINDINLEEVMAVVQISPSYSSYEFDKGGYIAFIKYDGSYNLVKIGPMENPEPFWGDTGLVFSETEADYFMSFDEKPVVRKSHKEGAAQSGPIVEKDARYFALYNVGFDGDGGYKYELSVTSKNDSHVYTLPYHVPAALAVCGDRIVGVTEEHFIDGMADDSRNTVYELRELTPEKGEGKIIAQHDSIFEGEKVSMAGEVAACVGGNTYVSPAFAENMSDVDKPVLDAWNIETSERSLIPLTTPDGTNFADSNDVPQSLFVEGNYIYGVEVTNGRLSKINAKTGEAEHLNKAELGSEEVFDDGSTSYTPDYDFTTAYSNGYVYQFVLDYKDYDNPHIRVIDVKTGKEEKRVSVPGLGRVIAELPYTGLAVNPNIDMERIAVKR